jgi:hypothetical protein
VHRVARILAERELRPFPWDREAVRMARERLHLTNQGSTQEGKLPPAVSSKSSLWHRLTIPRR